MHRGTTITVALATALAVAAATPSPALAGIDRQIRALERSSCPVPYEALHKRSYGPGALQRAMRWRFSVSNKRFRVNLRPPIKWGDNRFETKSYKAKLHALSFLDALFFIYNDSDRYGPSRKRAALRRARDIVLDFIESNPLGGKRVANKAWVNKVAGDRVGYIAYLTRAAECERLLNRADRKALLRSLKDHGLHLSRPRVYRPSNHGLSVDLGLGLLARYAPFLPGAAQWDELSQSRFRATLLRRLATGEGIWKEHSPSYQVLATKVLDTFVRATDPEDPLLGRLLGRMRRAATALVMPDGTMPQFGDTERSPAKPELRAAARDNGLEALLRYVGSGQAQRDGALDLLPGAASALLDASRGLIAFPEGGYAIVKSPTSGSYLAITSAFHNMSHKHADELSFELFERGRRIVSDTGLYNKDRNRFYDFQRSARAHSTLTVDGRDFGLRPSRAYGSGIRATGQGLSGWYAVLAGNPLLRRQGVGHERLFLYKPAEALIVVDRVDARRRHRYDRRFQLGPEIGIRKRGGALALGAAGFSGELYDARGTRASKRSTVRGERKTLEGYTFPSFRNKQRRWTVDYRSRERGAVHVTTISLNPARPLRAELPAGGDGDVVDVYSGGRRLSSLEVVRSGSGLLVIGGP